MGRCSLGSRKPFTGFRTPIVPSTLRTIPAPRNDRDSRSITVNYVLLNFLVFRQSASVQLRNGIAIGCMDVGNRRVTVPTQQSRRAQKSYRQMPGLKKPQKGRCPFLQA
jgi:hypothetical protein